MLDPKIFPTRRRFLASLGAASALSMAPAHRALAAGWPDRPVTIVVPYGPGASNDIFARSLADLLSKDLGQPFVVENRPGAGGFTGALSVVNAPADGYRFLLMPNSIASFDSVMALDLDATADVTPVAQLATAPGSMVVSSALPANTVQEFIAFANGREEDTFYGYVGVGATQHQLAEKFRKLTGVKMKGVNYQGSAEVTTDLLAGRLHVQFSTVSAVRGQVEAGELKILAYTNASSAPGSPPAPTMAEAGVAGMAETQVWWGIFGPAGLPPEVVTPMNAAVNRALGDAAVIDTFAKNGAVPTPRSPEEFAAAIGSAVASAKEFVEFTGIVPGGG
ncbi:Bug family tripartite tricarboxylate transporter substrate binding protein [Xinfangfangia pollutisoli]|uniref:Bug family tripartite tricarboxylate transporter substrate binding protein n=1 Tax=Xinfangfangia pollutisoli TaxID=2865960 RepID=UPI001CD62DDD|nr:tripartite tricarboxylate transporter substrate binding protein [Xinfangfangia pollutisoli]